MSSCHAARNVVIESRRAGSANGELSGPRASMASSCVRTTRTLPAGTTYPCRTPARSVAPVLEATYGLERVVVHPVVSCPGQAQEGPDSRRHRERRVPHLVGERVESSRRGAATCGNGGCFRLRATGGARGRERQRGQESGVAIHHVASLLYGESLHPEQIAQLQKEPVRRAAQIPEPERFRLAERRAVAQEYDGARRRLVGEQQVVPEVVRDDRARGVPVHEQRLPRTRVEQRGLVLREILPDVAHEDRACQLILELEPGDVRGREAAAVARAGEALVHPARFDTQGGRGAQGGDGR